MKGSGDQQRSRLEARSVKSGRRRGVGGVVGERRERRRGGMDVEDVATRAEVLVMAASR